MDLYGMFETDSSMEKSGILINYGDVRFTIARAGGSNEKFKRLFQQAIKPHRRQLDNETMSEEAMEDLMAEVYAKSVILGWESRENKDSPWKPVVKDRAGNEMPFTPENCKKLLLDLRELFRDIQSQAGKAALFRKVEDETDVGNSAKS